MIKQAKREADMGKSAKPVASAVRGTSLILGNAGSMLVHAHDGNIDHLPAPIATKCDRCGRD